MRLVQAVPFVFLITCLIACGPSRRGGGGGGGGDDDDSASDDDDVGPGGSLAVVSAVLSTTLPALVTRVRSDSGVASTLIGGTDNCEGYSEVVATSQEYVDRYTAGEITLDEYTALSVQLTVSYWGIGGYVAMISLGSEEEWTSSAEFQPPFVQFGRTGNAWDSSLGTLSEGFVSTTGFLGSIDADFPEFAGDFQGQAVWSGGDFNGELLDFEFVGSAALCDVDVRSP